MEYSGLAANLDLLSYSCIKLVVAEAAEIQTHGPLSILQLWYSLEQGLQASIRAKRKQILAKEW